MASEMGVSFYKNVKMVRGNAFNTHNDGTVYHPLTTAIDVTGYEYVDVIVHAGTLDSKLSCTLVKNTASKYTSGTVDVVNATYAKNTIATTDDNKMLTFHLQTDHLGNHQYLGLRTKGGAGSNDYIDVLFFLHGARAKPVSQSTAAIPTAHAKTYAG